ncbi:predicted protein [Nematostella vectensis]|uniref:Peptide-N-glycosidase F N-terminal domain-containing protein n=1 Tax=Nematostella vectensis TaxID=45351 RepID=A7RHJ8_NEMVE|nr:predicted protein [Nematostella vectensis]|eukprot:XP_001640928.1 predicted protein [Nematostella vectensis]
MRKFLLFLLILLTKGISSHAAAIPSLAPGDKAPPFTLQTHSGTLSYDKGMINGDEGSPVILAVFSNDSYFLESLFASPQQLFVDLFELSPDNAHYVFLFKDVKNAFSGASPEQKLTDIFIKTVYRYSIARSRQYIADRTRTNPVGSTRAPVRRKRFGTPVGDPSKFVSMSTFRQHWLRRVHFVTFPVHQLGNWIPGLLSQWACAGRFCGYDQIAVENSNGDVLNVFRRLDARYSWLPTVNTLTAKHRRLRILNINDSCASKFAENPQGSLALVSLEQGSCSPFTKIKNAQNNGALGVMAYAPRSGLERDLNCNGRECEQQLNIPATLIHSASGFRLTQVSGLYARFQTTPSDAFVFGIDGQGRVQQTSWFLFPSMRFLAYHAQWFDYVTENVYNKSGDARVISVFKDKELRGTEGITRQVTLPPYYQLQLYRHVELDMSVSCPGTGPDGCTHWDHVIRLFVTCDGSVTRGSELGRWIMAFKRRSNYWITPISSLLPLMKCPSPLGCTCNFTINTEAWVMPWTVRLDIRLSDKMQNGANYTTWRSVEKTLVPMSKTDLFTGRLFDENYNKHFAIANIKIPPRTARVKLVAAITGHGRDNNDCAGACITSHHFVVNGNYSNMRIFKNARDAPGCADRKVKGRTREDFRDAWLFGREGWCDGQEVVPWEKDITDQLRYGHGAANTISYYGWFNGSDPNPTQDPGIILMSSYLVYYEYRDYV